MKPLIDEIQGRVDVLRTILAEHGGSEEFDGSRPQALYAEELNVLTDTLKKLKGIFYNWGNSRYMEDKNHDGRKNHADDY